MDHSALSVILKLKEQLILEKEKYLKAIEEGKEFIETKEIMYSINNLQTELEKMIPQKTRGYQGL